MWKNNKGMHKKQYSSETIAWRCSIQNGVAKNFTKFTGKHLYPSQFFNKIAVNILRGEKILNIGGGHLTTSTALCLSDETSLVKKSKKKNNNNKKRQTKKRKSSGSHTKSICSKRVATIA